METPFNMMIVEMTGCGKTYCLLKMLEKEYFGHYIFLICPTYFWNWTYRDKTLHYPLPCNQNSVDGFLKYIVDNFKRYEQSDHTRRLRRDADCEKPRQRVNETCVLRKTLWTKYGRSYAQTTSIVKPYTENISKLVTFYNPSRKDMQTITDEFLNVMKDEVTNIVRKLKDNKYARLEILLRHLYVHEVVLT